MRGLILSKKQLIIGLALTVAITILVYASCIKYGFVSYDDPENVLQNPHITSINSTHVKAFFTEPLLYMYSPLVYISFSFDYFIGGFNPSVYHFTNLFIHILNVVLVFLLTLSLQKDRIVSLICCALFALHPLNCNTIVWISARSNLLFSLFFLSALLTWLIYSKTKSNRWLYVVSLLLFTLSCLSKSAAVVFPIVLLLIDFYIYKERLGKHLLEKAPFFLIALITGTVTIYFRVDTMSAGRVEYTIVNQALLWCYAILQYIFSCAVPYKLTAIYAYPNLKTITFIVYFAPIALGLILYLVYRYKKAEPLLVLSFLFFLIGISITQLGFLEDGFRANRYFYLPGIGLLLVASIILSRAIQKSKLFIPFTVVLIFIFAMLSLNQSRTWKTSLLLFNDVLEKEPNCSFAYNSRAIVKMSQNDFNGALSDYSKAISINPLYPEVYYNRGIAHYQTGNIQEAIQDYTKTISLNPNAAKAYMGRAIVTMDALKDPAGAINDYTTAIEINPAFAQAYYNRAIARFRIGQPEDACADLKKVKELGYAQADELITQFCK